MDRDPFDLVGDVLDGQFRVGELAGRGDLSVVYRGLHVGVGTPVAIKCLHLPQTLDGSLLRPVVDTFREACRLHQRVARGKANIAQVVAFGSALAPASGMIVPYLVREWLDGESLHKELERRRREGRTGRSIDEAVALLDPVADALAHAHAQGVQHLALHPSNLFLADHAGARSLRVLDFGVARAMNDFALDIPPESRPSTGLRVLFPAYSAPEQRQGSLGMVGAWTDVHALALVLLELLSDRPPPTHGLGLPPGLEIVLTRAISRDPQRRHRTVTDFWKDVKASMRASPIAVVGAVPAKRVVVPEQPSMETIPLGFRPPASGPYVPASAPVSSTRPAEERPADVDLPPVHVLVTPPAPQAATPALPPVIVNVDTPAPVPALPPPLPPAPTFPILERVAGRKRSGAAWISAVAAVVGAGIGIAVVVSVKRHSMAQASMQKAPTTAPPSASSSAPPPSLQAPSAEPVASVAPQTAEVPGPPPLSHFPAAAAKQSLDAVAREIAHCKRGKVWGIAEANVTFGNDGAVSHVAVGVPFTGTTTGTCVSDALSGARVAAFSGKPGVVTYRFFVPPK